ncbi:hypothetical protein BDV12DRAFT_192096 [Aspergillus spectabilis]
MPTPPCLRIAIIGAGPAGLSAAIELQKLPFVDLRIYGQASVLREIGTGLNIQRNTWRMLDVMDASRNISLEEIFRSADGHAVQHRNGRTGELIQSHGQGGTPPAHLHARAFRSVLQKALLKNVDNSQIYLSSQLISITETPTGSLALTFSNNRTSTVDLLIGADGVRSLVRQFAFPDYNLVYTGKTAYRGLIPAERLLSIPGFPDAVTFWHGPKDCVYTCNLRHGVYELTCLANVPDDGERKKEILGQATEIQQFALFTGAGAGFALEDSYVLSQTLSWAHNRGHSISCGLDLYDRVRSPHYKAMYDILSGFGRSDAEMDRLNLGFDEAVAHSFGINGGRSLRGFMGTMYVQAVWEKAVQEEDARMQQAAAYL